MSAITLAKPLKVRILLHAISSFSYAQKVNILVWAIYGQDFGGIAQLEYTIYTHKHTGHIHTTASFLLLSLILATQTDGTYTVHTDAIICIETKFKI